MTKQKNKILVYLEYIPFYFYYSLIRVLPFKSALRVARWSAVTAFYVDWRHRKRTIQHIMHAGMAADKKAAFKLGKECYRQFLYLLVEMIKFEQFYDPQKIKVTGDPESIEYFWRHNIGESVKNPVIILSAHYGNWELAGRDLSERTQIMITSVMRPFSNPKIGELMLKNRTGKLHRVVDKKGGIRGLLKALQNGESVALLVDQHAGGEDGVESFFFGQPCRTHKSPALLHLHTGVPILPLVTRRDAEPGHFTVELGKLIRYSPTGNKEEDVRNIMKAYNETLESFICEEPSQWLWAHRRWTNLNR